jgi:hypothetical protein
MGTADTAETKAEIMIVNGGRHSVLFSTIIRNPAYVKTVVPGRIVTSDDGLTIAFTYPPDFQNVGGVPVGLQQLTITLNRGGAVTTALCDSDWHYAAAVAFVDHTTARHQGRMTCRPSRRGRARRIETTPVGSRQAADRMGKEPPSRAGRHAFVGRVVECRGEQWGNKPHESQRKFARLAIRQKPPISGYFASSSKNHELTDSPHNPKVAGPNPAPATTKTPSLARGFRA